MIGSVIRITATDAARKLSDLLNRVRYRGETFEVVRGGEVVARITAAPLPEGATARELLAALARVGDPDDAFADDLARVQAEQPALPGDPWDS